MILIAPPTWKGLDKIIQVIPWACLNKTTACAITIVFLFKNICKMDSTDGETEV